MISGTLVVTHQYLLEANLLAKRVMQTPLCVVASNVCADPSLVCRGPVWFSAVVGQ